MIFRLPPGVLLPQSEVAAYPIARLHALLGTTSDALALLSTDGVLIDVSARWSELLGMESARLIGRPLTTFLADPGGAEALSRHAQRSRPWTARYSSVPFRRANGEVVHVDIDTTTIKEGEQSVVFALAHDVTEVDLGREERELAQEGRPPRGPIPEAIWALRHDGVLTFMTPNVQSLLGLSFEELYRSGGGLFYSRTHPDDVAALREAVGRLLARGEPYDLEFRWRRGDGSWVWLRSRGVGTFEQDGERHVEGLLADVTAAHHLEEGLRHARTMESIRQIAGALSTRFGALLKDIVSSADALLGAIEEDDPRRSDAENNRAASEQASSLIHQLVAFSQGQALTPTLFSVNDTVTELEPVLRRLLGGEITLSIERDPELGQVHADEGQVKRALLNLAANARDAMPGGGSVSIETRNVELDESYASLLAGRYVRVAVSDTGRGMSREVQERIFEPFFTTKSSYSHAGLGLATVYGIMKQSAGHVSVSAEVERGSVFHLYLPRVDGAAPRRARSSLPPP